MQKCHARTRGVITHGNDDFIERYEIQLFLEESPIDFDDFEASAKFAFSLGGCCKPENVNPCAGQEVILFCFWPSVAL